MDAGNKVGSKNRCCIATLKVVSGEAAKRASHSVA